MANKLRHILGFMRGMSLIETLFASAALSVVVVTGLAVTSDTIKSRTKGDARVAMLSESVATIEKARHDTYADDFDIINGTTEYEREITPRKRLLDSLTRAQLEKLKATYAADGGKIKISTEQLYAALGDSQKIALKTAMAGKNENLSIFLDSTIDDPCAGAKYAAAGPKYAAKTGSDKSDASGSETSGKSEKSEKSGKSGGDQGGSDEECSDESDASGSETSGKSEKSEKSEKSGKSEESGKSGKSGKSEKSSDPQPFDGTITITGVKRQGNGKFRVSGPQCDSLPNGGSNSKDDRICTLENLTADTTVTITFDPEQSYCSSQGNRSVNSFDQLITLTSASPSKTLTVELVQNKASWCQNGPLVN